MFKKIIAIANRPKKPITKDALLRFLRWQMAWLGFASVIAILDLLGVVVRPASVVLCFVLMPMGLSAVAYLDIREVGLKQEETDSISTTL